MAKEKEIRSQIASIKSTQKITSAMELVAASKMKKTQFLMEKSRAYAEKILQIAGHIANSKSGEHHPFIKQRQIKRVGYIIVSSNRGLCGSLNSSLFRTIIENLTYWRNKNVEVEFCLIGKKAASFFQSIGDGNISAVLLDINETPKVANLIGGVKVMIDAYKKQRIDKLFIAHNKFINSIVQKPATNQVLPLPPNTEHNTNYAWDYVYEENPRELLDKLIQRYLESQVYQAVVENNACEQASRMVAMKNATDNANTIIGDLQLIYNKARQAAITQEISEIISGAAAV